MTITVKAKWTQGMQFIARTDGGPAVVMDSPDGGSGASPMEMMLMGVAGCTGMDVMTILAKKRMVVTGFNVHISGTRSEGYPRRYTEVEIEYVVEGADINPTGVQQAIDLSTSKYCGAMASLNATITTRFRIEPS